MANKKATSISQTFLFILCVFSAAILLFNIAACHFSYVQRKDNMLARLDLGLNELDQEYENITENFWKTYMPFSHLTWKEQTAVTACYDNSVVSNDPLILKSLIGVMQEMIQQDDHILWVAFVPQNTKDAKVLYRGSTNIQTADNILSYKKYIRPDHAMQELPVKRNLVNGIQMSENTFAICGSAPQQIGTGKVFVGYSIEAFNNICNEATGENITPDFCISADNRQVIYSSKEQLKQPDHPSGKTTGDYTAKHDPVIKQTISDQDMIYYTVSRREVNKYANRNTPTFFLLSITFLLLTSIIYYRTTKKVEANIKYIQQGLNTIGTKDFDYTLNDHIGTVEFNQIATSINRMRLKLKRNINAVYFYQVKHKEAEIAELQSKFNPHFLYNTLEMLRSHIYDNGDIETAELTSQMATIFRSFIGRDIFLTIREELNFTRKYLDILKTRYDGKLSILFDIPSAMLGYGIIRNIFQPIVENYFVHGFDSDKVDNQIAIKGELHTKTIQFTVSDNGKTVSAEKAAEINRRLSDTVCESSDSYGLKNVNQRLHLFYGDDCGISVSPGTEGGFIVYITICVMTVDAYKEQKARLTRWKPDL